MIFIFLFDGQIDHMLFIICSIEKKTGNFKLENVINQVQIARPKIKSQSQIYRYGRSIFCLPHRPKISGFFDLCVHWVSVVRGVVTSTNEGTTHVSQHSEGNLIMSFKNDPTEIKAYDIFSFFLLHRFTVVIRNEIRYPRPMAFKADAICAMLYRMLFYIF